MFFVDGSMFIHAEHMSTHFGAHFAQQLYRGRGIHAGHEKSQSCNEYRIGIEELYYMYAVSA